MSTGSPWGCSRRSLTSSPRSGAPTTGRTSNAHAPLYAKRAIGSFNLDLIYGTPGESLDDWRRTLDDVLALEPGHLSAYALTVEAGTPLATRVGSGESPPPDDDDQALKYEIADQRLRSAGLDWYEISNFAAHGDECRHNSLYWSGDDYLAVGCSGHGFTDGRRWWNVRRPEDYIACIESGRSPERGSETLSAAGRDDEALMLGLRTRSGIPADAVASAPAAALIAAGLLAAIDDRLRLTLSGRLVASEVTARLVGFHRPVDPDLTSVD